MVTIPCVVVSVAVSVSVMLVTPVHFQAGVPAAVANMRLPYHGTGSGVLATGCALQMVERSVAGEL